MASTRLEKVCEIANSNPAPLILVEEIPWLRSIASMDIWIKGVLTAEDVLLARQYGCDGVIVSNHGGRQLDGVPPTIDALPECVKAADRKVRVHIDGRIRSGTDIFEALALGAECCWVGRPILWALAVSLLQGCTMLFPNGTHANFYVSFSTMAKRV